MKIVFKYIFSLVILILLYNLIMYGISLFPSEWIYENSLKSAEALVEEGGILTIFPSFYCVDNYSDVLVINEAYSIDSDNSLESYLKARKNYKKGLTKYQLEDSTHELLSYSKNNIVKGTPECDEKYDPNLELLNFMNNKVEISVNYARYYHGYLALYRPLLLLFDVIGIRIIQLIVFVLLIVWLAYELYKKMGKRIAFSIVISLIIFDAVGISYSLQQAPLFMLLLVTCIVLVKNIEKINWKNIFYGSMIVGSLACFVDFFTIPALTLTIPLFIYLIYYLKTTKYVDEKSTFKNVFITCVLWALGYGITWLSKWIISDLLVNTSVVQGALEQIKYRSIGAIGHPLGDYLLVFLKHLAYVFVLTQVIILILSELDKRKSTIKGDEKNAIKKAFAPSLIFISLVPILWCIVTKNHFILHIFMTYRNLILLCMLVFLIFFNELSLKKK